MGIDKNCPCAHNIKLFWIGILKMYIASKTKMAFIKFANNISINVSTIDSFLDCII